MIEENFHNLIKTSLSPEKIRLYLITNDWHLLKSVEGSVSIWETKDRNKNDYQIWLPLNSHKADYYQNILALLDTVASAKETSQEQIIEDLDNNLTSDVIKLSTWDNLDKNSGTIPLKDGLALFDRAKSLVTAAALSTEKKRAVYPSYRSPEISNYLNKIRLGQTEKGSYLIKIISPISALNQENLPHIDKVPFEREVVVNLMKSLTQLREVSITQLESGKYKFEDFQDLVNDGVSANLCEAVISLNEKKVHASPFKIDVAWSYSVEKPEEKFRPVIFDNEVLPFIAQAAKEFRETSPEHIKIVGYIKGLEHDVNQTLKSPKIVLKAMVEDKTHSINIELNEAEYDVAIDAHKNGDDISIEGVLQKNGNSLQLTEPHNIKLIKKKDENKLID